MYLNIGKCLDMSVPNTSCVVVIFFLTSCALKINTVYDEMVLFSDYKTFCWFENCQFTIDGPIYLKRDSVLIESFRVAIVQELERKGYAYTRNSPDFLVHLRIIVEEREGIIGSPYQQYAFDGEFPLDIWSNIPYTYLKGSLIIDIADADESKMVWRSDVVEYMNIKSDLAGSRLKRGVRKALKKFPPDSNRVF